MSSLWFTQISLKWFACLISRLLLFATVHSAWCRIKLQRVFSTFSHFYLFCLKHSLQNREINKCKFWIISDLSLPLIIFASSIACWGLWWTAILNFFHVIFLYFFLNVENTSKRTGLDTPDLKMKLIIIIITNKAGALDQTFTAFCSAVVNHRREDVVQG